MPLLFFLFLQFLKREFGLVVLLDVAPTLNVVSGLQVVHYDGFHRIEIGIDLAAVSPRCSVGCQELVCGQTIFALNSVAVISTSFTDILRVCENL